MGARVAPSTLAWATAILCAFVLLPAVGRAGAEVDRYVGVSALASSAAARAESRIVAHLDVRPIGPDDRLLDFSETRAGTTLRSYAIDMTKRMHLIVISDDFTIFEHLHPTLAKDGHFTLVFHAPKPGGYHFYADTSPVAVGQTVFRFDVPVVAGSFAALQRPADHHAETAVHLAPTPDVVHAGPYTVALGTLALHATQPTTIAVTVSKNGRPATDLRPYLGGAAHAVFIDAKTLAYVHVHPMDATARGESMSGMADMPDMPAPLPEDARIGGTMTLHVGPLAAGTYKLWLQFRGAGGLHVAPFVLVAK